MGRVPLGLSLLLATACSGDFEFKNVTGDQTFDASGGGGDGKAFFETNVQSLLSVNHPTEPCVLCHQGTDTANGPILFGADGSENYDSIKSNGLITTDPTTSRILTKGEHAGGNEFGVSEVATITEWIDLEAGN